MAQIKFGSQNLDNPFSNHRTQSYEKQLEKTVLKILFSLYYTPIKKVKME